MYMLQKTQQQYDSILPFLGLVVFTNDLQILSGVVLPCSRLVDHSGDHAADASRRPRHLSASVQHQVPVVPRRRRDDNEETVRRVRLDRGWHHLPGWVNI